MSTLDRPDLDEFLSALDGFLEKPTAPQDPGYLKFLEIFCRSVGAGEGHLLMPNPTGGLESIVAFGVAPEFNRKFNENRDPNRPCPLDTAFEKQKVEALVEVKRGDVPDWYVDLIEKQGFKSLVAVPLLGHSEAVGILCAYYQDVCLFDQGTLDRLLVIGRMVGAATEKSMAAGRAVTHDAKDEVADAFIRLLTLTTVPRSQIFQYLVDAVMNTIQPDGVMAGPLRPADNDLAVTVAAVAGIPTSIVSQRLVLPRDVHRQILSSAPAAGAVVLTQAQAGPLAPFFKSTPSATLSAPLVFQGKAHSAVVAWREASRPFDAESERLLARLSGVASLAFQAAGV